MSGGGGTIYPRVHFPGDNIQHNLGYIVLGGHFFQRDIISSDTGIRCTFYYHIIALCVCVCVCVCVHR